MQAVALGARLKNLPLWKNRAQSRVLHFGQRMQLQKNHEAAAKGQQMKIITGPNFEKKTKGSAEIPVQKATNPVQLAQRA